MFSVVLGTGKVGFGNACVGYLEGHAGYGALSEFAWARDAVVHYLAAGLAGAVSRCQDEIEKMQDLYVALRFHEQLMVMPMPMPLMILDLFPLGAWQARPYLLRQGLWKPEGDSTASA